MSKIYKQTNDYNCGPTALAQLLNLKGYQEYTPEGIEEIIQPSPDMGTSHLSICLFLDLEKFTYQHGTPGLHNLTLPMLVNYSPKGDGHYGVVTRINFTSNRVRVLDPEDGQMHSYTIKNFFNTWYSSRYGKEWAVWDLRKE